MSVTYLKNAAAASLCDKIGNVILDRTINDLIFGLDMAADRIPDDLGGANEAHVAINPQRAEGEPCTTCARRPRRLTAAPWRVVPSVFQ